jgi:hypothetical protein
MLPKPRHPNARRQGRSGLDLNLLGEKRTVYEQTI